MPPIFYLGTDPTQRGPWGLPCWRPKRGFHRLPGKYHYANVNNNPGQSGMMQWSIHKIEIPLLFHREVFIAVGSDSLPSPLLYEENILIIPCLSGNSSQLFRWPTERTPCLLSEAVSMTMRSLMLLPTCSTKPQALSGIKFNLFLILYYNSLDFRFYPY